LWLLGTIKKIVSGLDEMAKKHILHESLLKVLTMRQGCTESNAEYMKRFTTYLQTLDVAGGRHILCSPKIVDAVDTKNPTRDEINAEEERFKAMCHLKRSDSVRYGKMLKSLEESPDLGRGEYPTTVATTCDLMARQSSQLNDGYDERGVR